MNTLGERKWHPPKDGKISMICYLYRSGEGDDSLARSFDSYELRRVCESVPAAQDDLNTLQLALHHGQHGVPAAYGKQPDAGKGDKQLPVFFHGQFLLAYGISYQNGFCKVFGQAFYKRLAVCYGNGRFSPNGVAKSYKRF